MNPHDKSRKFSFNPHFIKFSFIPWQHGYTHHIGGFSSLELVRSVPKLLVGGNVETSLDRHAGPFFVS